MQPTMQKWQYPTTMISMKITALFFLLFVSSFLFAQEKDFQTWYTLGTSYRVNEKLKLSFENETRFRENSTITDRNHFDIGGEYSLNSHWSAGLFYRFIASEPFSDQYTGRHRFYTDFVYEWKPLRFEISARVRLSSDSEDSEAFSDVFSAGIHREKLVVKYNIRKTSFTPYVAAEVYFPLQTWQHYLQRYRLFTGFTYRLNKANRVGLSFMQQHKFGNTRQSLQYVLMVDYSYRIK